MAKQKNSHKGGTVLAKEAARQEIEEDCEVSTVPETSPSMSRTIGSKDTDGEEQGKGGDGQGLPTKNQSYAEVVSKEQPKKTFAALFQDNRNPNKGIPLAKVENAKGEVDISFEEVDTVESALGFTLLGYVAGGFPGMEAVRRLTNTWNAPHKFHIHKSGWLIFRFEELAEKERVLQGGPYLIYGRPLILKDLPPLFEFGACTHSEIPVWITLPGLPIDLWNAKALGRICSMVGDPICTDAMTSKKERLSYARVLVNVDLEKDLVKEIRINLPNGKVRSQYVSYESLPKFCSFCKMMGHATEFCKKAKLVEEAKASIAKESCESAGAGNSSDGPNAGHGAATTTTVRQGKGAKADAKDSTSIGVTQKAEKGDHQGAFVGTRSVGCLTASGGPVKEVSTRVGCGDKSAASKADLVGNGPPAPPRQGESNPDAENQNLFVVPKGKSKESHHRHRRSKSLGEYTTASSMEGMANSGIPGKEKTREVRRITPIPIVNDQPSKSVKDKGKAPMGRHEEKRRKGGSSTNFS